MKVPLLVAARPRFIGESPRVPLERGRWRVTADHKDSTLYFCRGSSPPVQLNGVPLIVEITEPSELVWLQFAFKGREDCVHAFAEST